MKRQVSKVCPQCEKEICDDAESCRIDNLAERERDFDDWVASMEDAIVDRMINEKRGK